VARTAVVADAREGAGVGRVVLLPARVRAVERVDAGRALARGGVARGAAVLEAGRDGAAEVARVRGGGQAQPQRRQRQRASTRSSSHVCQLTCLFSYAPAEHANPLHGQR